MKYILYYYRHHDRVTTYPLTHQLAVQSVPLP